MIPPRSAGSKLMASSKYRDVNPHQPRPRKPFLVLIGTGLFVMGLSLWSLSGNPSSIISQLSFGLGLIEFMAGCWLALWNFHDGASRDAWEEGFTSGLLDHQLHGTKMPIGTITMPPNASMNDLRRMMGLLDPEEEEPPRKRTPKHTAHGPTEVDLECAACRVAIEEVLKSV